MLCMRSLNDLSEISIRHTIPQAIIRRISTTMRASLAEVERGYLLSDDDVGTGEPQGQATARSICSCTPRRQDAMAPMLS